jgi:hypothetical protein
MQEPLLSAMPPPNQAVGRDRPDPLRSPMGPMYPRWPLLSAISINAGGVIGYFLWRFASCPASALGPLGGLCHAASWPNWLQFALVWLAFLVGWLLAFIFGYGTIELSRRREVGVRRFFRSISHFEPIRHLLYIYGGLALLSIIVLWWLGRLQAVPFALASIIFFVALWTYIRRQRRPARQLSEEELLQQSVAATTSPWYVFRSLPLIRGIIPPRPLRNQGNPGTAAPGMQPPPDVI